MIQEYDRRHLDQKDKVKMSIVTINCGGKTPDSYKELLPVFKSGTPENFEPDIIAVGLQEIVKLNALSIFQGKNTSKMQIWEKLLSDTIEVVYGG